MRRSLKYLLIPLLAFASDIQASNENCISSIRSISIEGNEDTRRASLIAWSGLRIGRRIDAKALAAARQKLFDKGLFKDVDIISNDLCAAEVDIKIVIKEKIYHLVYPRISRNGDGDIGLGIRYRGSNLFGADQSLAIAYTEKEYANGEDEEDIKFNYELPMIEAPYLMRWSAQRTNSFITPSTQVVTEKTDRFAFEVGRDWVSHPFELPITVLATIGFSELSLDRLDPALETRPGQFNTLGIALEYDDLHEEKYRRYGRFFSFSLNKGQRILGSDYSASWLRTEARFLVRLNPTNNLNTRLLVELSSAKVFNEFAYEIGSSRTIRGVEPESEEGNARWLMNIEYLKGYARWPSFRTALFTDIGNVFKDAGTLNDRGWKTAFGLGFRWKLTSFVKTDLVIDYAYNPEDEYSKIYGSTSVMF